MAYKEVRYSPLHYLLLILPIPIFYNIRAALQASYHVYKAIWMLLVGNTSACQREEDIMTDPFAVDDTSIYVDIFALS